jgi:hypothetical protein
MARLHRAISAYKPDVLLFDIPERIPQLVLGLLLSLRTRLVTVIHDAVPHDAAHSTSALVGFLQRLVIKKSVALVTFSDNSLKEIMVQYPQHQVFQVPLVPSLPANSMEVVLENRKNFAMIGRWSEYKGFDIGLKIWADYCRMSNTDSQMDMWCSGLEEPIATEPNVRWRAFSSYTWEDFSAALPHYRGILMPYRSASQSGVQILAWDAGVPCIIPNLPGLEELQPACFPSIPLDHEDAWLDSIRTLDSSNVSIELGLLGKEESQRMRGDDKVYLALAECFQMVCSV